MTKRNKIIYWISTIWLALGMLATGTLQLFKAKAEGAVAPPRGIWYYPFGLSRLFSNNTKCLENFGSCSIAYS